MAAASPLPSPRSAPSSVPSTGTPGRTRRKPTAWWSASTAGSAARCWASPSGPHRQLERLQRGFNAAYNARRQRVLDGKTPDQVVAERLKARRRLARGKPEGRAGPADIANARRIAEAAKEVPQIGRAHV